MYTYIHQHLCSSNSCITVDCQQLEVIGDVLIKVYSTKNAGTHTFQHACMLVSSAITRESVNVYMGAYSD